MNMNRSNKIQKIIIGRIDVRFGFVSATIIHKLFRA